MPRPGWDVRGRRILVCVISPRRELVQQCAGRPWARRSEEAKGGVGL